MVADPESDAELMLRVKRGDLTAFEVLVEKYQQPITNLIARTLNDPVEAEDLAQNVFIQVYRSAHRYQAVAKFSTWLYTIARNLCLNEIRRRARHPAEPLDPGMPADEEHLQRQIPDVQTQAPPEALLRVELEQKVQQALASLPENQRLSILLYQEEDLSYDEISQVLGCSLSATKSLIHRGRETLKEMLKPYLRLGKWPGPPDAPQL